MQFIDFIERINGMCRKFVGNEKLTAVASYSSHVNGLQVSVIATDYCCKKCNPDNNMSGHILFEMVYGDSGEERMQKVVDLLQVIIDEQE